MRLVGYYAAHAYPASLRRVRYYDLEHDRYLTFLTNAFDLPALTVAAIYKARWQIELFFKWIKQHLRITAFYGTSANAVEPQVWIALSVYVLVPIVKRRLALSQRSIPFSRFWMSRCSRKPISSLCCGRQNPEIAIPQIPTNRRS